MQKLPIRLEGDQVMFRGELSYHKDTRTNFTISHNSEARNGPKVRARGAPKVRARGCPKVRARGGPHLRARGGPKVRARGEPKVRARGGPKVWARGRSKESRPKSLAPAQKKSRLLSSQY